MKSRIIVYALTLGLGIVPLSAQPYGSMPPQRDLATGRIAKALRLTEDQKSQIQAIQARHADTGKRTFEALTAARKAFQDAARDPNANTEQLKALHTAQADATFAWLIDRRAMRNEVRAVLTPEQRADWDRFMAKRQEDDQLGYARHGRRGKRLFGF